VSSSATSDRRNVLLKPQSTPRTINLAARLSPGQRGDFVQAQIKTHHFFMMLFRSDWGCAYPLYSVPASAARHRSQVHGGKRSGCSALQNHSGSELVVFFQPHCLQASGLVVGKGGEKLVQEKCHLCLRLGTVVRFVPEVDSLHFSRPAGGSQSHLISQNKSASLLLSRASQTGQPGWRCDGG